MARPYCTNHGADLAVTSCVLCRRPLCDACFEHSVDGRPACRLCAYEVATRGARGRSLAVSFVGLGAGALFFAWRKGMIEALVPLVASSALVLVIGVAVFAATKKPGGSVEQRDREAELDPAATFQPTAASPFRQHVRNVSARVAPRVSGAATAGAVAAAFVACAVLFPVALKLPRWVEAEVTLGGWWAVLTGVLAALLHRGYRLRDDMVFVAPWDRLGKDGPSEKRAGPSPGTSVLRGCGDFASCGDGCSGIDGEAAVVLVVGAALIAVLLGAAWIVAEIALPIVLYVGYAVVSRALMRVAHDRHGCEGDLAKSVGWGALWATIYLAPLALLVVILHRVG